MQFALMDDWDFLHFLALSPLSADNKRIIRKENSETAKGDEKAKHCVFDIASTYVGFAGALVCFTLNGHSHVMQFVYCYYYRKLHSFIHPIWNWWQYRNMYMRYLCFPLHYFLLLCSPLFFCEIHRLSSFFGCFDVLCAPEHLMRKNNGEETHFREVSVDWT